MSRKEDYPSETSSGRGCFFIVLGAPANGTVLSRLLSCCIWCARISCCRRAAFLDCLLICLWAEWYQKLVSGQLGTMTVGGMVLMVGFTCLSTNRPWTGGIDSLYPSGLVPLVRSLLVLMVGFTCFSTTRPWTGGIDSLYLAGLVPFTCGMMVLKQVFSGFSTTCP